MSSSDTINPEGLPSLDGMELKIIHGGAPECVGCHHLSGSCVSCPTRAAADEKIRAEFSRVRARPEREPVLSVEKVFYERCDHCAYLGTVQVGGTFEGAPEYEPACNLLRMVCDDQAIHNCAGRWYLPRAEAAAEEFIRRRTGQSVPDVESEYRECCKSVNVNLSHRWGRHNLVSHCKSLRHVAGLYHVTVPALIAARKEVWQRNRARGNPAPAKCKDEA